MEPGNASPRQYHRRSDRRDRACPFAKGHGFEDSIYYEHGSTLRTMQDIFGMMPLLRDARRQRDLRSLFAIFP